jgi:hypothetical protein
MGIVSAMSLGSKALGAGQHPRSIIVVLVAPPQAVAQDEQDAAECGAVRHARRSAVVTGWLGREERLDRLAELVSGHPERRQVCQPQ